MPVFSTPYRNPRTELLVLIARPACFNTSPHPHTHLDSLLCILKLQAKVRDDRREEGGLWSWTDVGSCEAKSKTKNKMKSNKKHMKELKRNGEPGD